MLPFLYKFTREQFKHTILPNEDIKPPESLEKLIPSPPKEIITRAQSTHTQIRRRGYLATRANPLDANRLLCGVTDVYLGDNYSFLPFFLYKQQNVSFPMCSNREDLITLYVTYNK